MSPVPKWIDQGIPGRRARHDTCRKCGAPVLRGLDSDVAGIDRQADPTPIDRANEFQALMAGLATFTAWPIRDGIELDRRDRWRIEGPLTRHPTYPEHACGRTWPAIPETAKIANREDCPF